MKKQGLAHIDRSDSTVAIKAAGSTLFIQKGILRNVDIPYHSHSYTELLLITGGRGEHHTEGGITRLSEGELFVFPADIPHGFSNTDDLHLINIMFDPALFKRMPDDLKKIPGFHALFILEPLMRREQTLPGMMKLHADQLAYTTRLIHQMYDWGESEEPGSDSLAFAGFIQLLVFLSQNYNNRKSVCTGDLRIAHAASYIERHFAEKIDLNRLASLSSLSPTRFLELFKKHYGTSPIQYLLTLRIKMAKDLLMNTVQPITEIAFDCGFNDSNYFARRFKQECGITPRQWRRQNSKNSPCG
jgi:AraC family L-rhamnose operon transcriptional activator RhaR/AraC family L-rhamnose operon regulatory protein RhaS